MAGLDRKRVVVVDSGFESYDIEKRVLAPLDADVILDPCHGDPARIKIATAEADAVLSNHTAWYSEESLADLQTKAAEEVARVLKGDRPGIGSIPGADVSAPRVERSSERKRREYRKRRFESQRAHRDMMAFALAPLSIIIFFRPSAMASVDNSFERERSFIVVGSGRLVDFESFEL